MNEFNKYFTKSLLKYNLQDFQEIHKQICDDILANKTKWQFVDSPSDYSYKQRLILYLDNNKLIRMWNQGNYEIEFRKKHNRKEDISLENGIAYINCYSDQQRMEIKYFEAGLQIFSGSINNFKPYSREMKLKNILDEI